MAAQSCFRPSRSHHRKMSPIDNTILTKSSFTIDNILADKGTILTGVRKESLDICHPLHRNCHLPTEDQDLAKKAFQVTCASPVTVGKASHVPIYCSSHQQSSAFESCTRVNVCSGITHCHEEDRHTTTPVCTGHDSCSEAELGEFVHNRRFYPWSSNYQRPRLCFDSPCGFPGSTYNVVKVPVPATRMHCEEHHSCRAPLLPPVLQHHHCHEDLFSRRGGQIRFSNYQSYELERVFSIQKYISPQERRYLSRFLDLSERQIKTWFQNRRAKWRRMRIEAKESEKQETKDVKD